MSFGYHGKILRVDLSSGKTKIDEHDEEFYRTYMGGAGIGLYYLLKEQKPGIDPFSPDNMLIFTTSVVTGIPASGFARHTITTKSPLTGALGESHGGGFWGPELKFAGWDGVIVTGKSDKPVYLWINDGAVEIKDASGIWGKETKEAEEIIRDELDDKRVRVLQIGPAGENLVRFANVTNNLKHFNGRTGTGAVMGSKNLRAIAVRGSIGVNMFDKETIAQKAKWFRQNNQKNPANLEVRELGTAGIINGHNAMGMFPTRNFKTGYFEKADQLSGETMAETILTKREGCYACSVICKRVVECQEPYVVDPAYGGPEYETIAALGSCCGVDDLKIVAKGNEICGKNGMDTISAGASISFAMECYENGILTDEDTGGIDLRFGNADAMITVLEMMAKREGIGDLLADGTKRASEKIGKGSDKYAMHAKGQEFAMHEPRVKGMLGISYALSELGGDHTRVEHDADFDFQAPEVFMEQAKSLGILERLDTSTIDENKIRMFYYLQNHFSFLDTLCCCLFCFAPVRAFSMADLVCIISAATGWEVSLWELMKLGERRTNMARAFIVREGFSKSDDWLPERMFEEIPDGPSKGRKVTREGLEKALDLYYRMAGWDAQKAMPSESKLIELSLGWLADMLYPERMSDAK
jgi:aldehyde:ferredoxin oxidoreductase